MTCERRALSPVRLPPNPVWRSYSGGSVLRRFRGMGEGPDDHYPEDWLASTVRARNGAHSQHPDEGLSRAGEDTVLLADALAQDPAYWFGRSADGAEETGVLWKLLDASVRLQLQAHPHKAFAERFLNSKAGKTECWYILDTRADACVYLGFQRPPTRREWGRMMREQDTSAMLACFEPIPVKPGECLVVPAGTPHAIGSGVFMVELMEPTDWVVRCETANTGVQLDAAACFMGLSLDLCLDVFDYRAYSVKDVCERFVQSPRICGSGTGFCEELIGGAWRSFFRLNRWRGTGKWAGGELLLLIAVRGQGRLSTGNVSREVKAGEVWLLPGAAPGWTWEGADSELLIARRPEKA